MSYRPKKIPWDKSEYVILEERNELWLRGSFMRSMRLHHAEEDFGYKVLLASQEFIDKLRKDPSVREKVKLETTETSD